MNMEAECSSEGGEGRKVAQKDGIFFKKELSGYINCHSLLLVYIYIISVKFHNNFCPNGYFFSICKKGTESGEFVDFVQWLMEDKWLI